MRLAAAGRQQLRPHPAAPRPAAAPDRWRLAERIHLNPGSPGGPLFQLRLAPLQHLPHWRAGDIAVVEIPLPDGTRLRREYSLASLPADGQAQLIVRRTADGAGQPGPGSDWLTRRLQTGVLLGMRIRENPGFHSSDDRRPMVLIGAGSGLSGLVAHIRQRASATAPGPVWLLFGERSRGRDAILNAELQDWLRRGVLRRLDRTFSRDEDGPRYMHGLLRRNAATLADWDAQGAGFYICGRREGMGRDAERALADILGEARLQELMLSGRFLRDVY